MRGLGDAKAVRVKAALELRHRLAVLSDRSPLSLVSASQVPRLFLLAAGSSRLVRVRGPERPCSPRLPSCALVLSHSLAGRTFTTQE